MMRKLGFDMRGDEYSAFHAMTAMSKEKKQKIMALITGHESDLLKNAPNERCIFLFWNKGEN